MSDPYFYDECGWWEQEEEVYYRYLEELERER
jgi:hypothetical protein